MYHKDDFGWFLYLRGETGTISDYKGLPEDLYKCVLLALELGCEILCLDCDGEETDLLEKYDW